MGDKKLGLLMSGGLDSYIMWHYAQIEEGWKKEDILPVYIDLNSPYAEKEKKALERHRKEVIDTKIIDCKILQEQFGNVPDNEDIWIPGRNLLLASIMASLNCDEIWLGALKGEMHKYATDKNKKFFDKATDTISYVMSKFKDEVVVKTPFEDMNKLDIVIWALKNYIDPYCIAKTSSCLSGEGQNCGNCMVCVRRYGIFEQTGLSEEYDEYPVFSEVGEEYITELFRQINGGEHYNADRIVEVLPALTTEEFYYFLRKVEEEE